MSQQLACAVGQTTTQGTLITNKFMQVPQHTWRNVVLPVLHVANLFHIRLSEPQYQSQYCRMSTGSHSERQLGYAAASLACHLTDGDGEHHHIPLYRHTGR
ncbi:hypothetical protein TRVL_10075 [Trypanosoma vivax]|nr:hypothetical protein TRVL_10075 [Trypanosoma vivax]